jgi:hypothetical protein
VLLYLQDVFDFCGLSEQEIRALAKHEHISQVSAAAFGSSLLESKEGSADIERFMRDDIEDDVKSHRPSGRRPRAGFSHNAKG